MPFKQGQSGNPRGRPKKGEAMTDLLREKIETTKTTREKHPRHFMRYESFRDRAGKAPEGCF
jgi:hypothetical protein